MAEKALQTNTYVFFKKMPVLMRRLITISLLLLGFALQLKTHYIIGTLFILAASLLNLLRAARLKKPVSVKDTWERVTFAEFNKAIERIKQIKKWQGFSLAGRITLVVILTFTAAICGPALAAGAFPSPTAKAILIFIVDFYLLFAPMYISGYRSAWIPPDMEIKLKTLAKVAEYDFIKSQAHYKVQPYMFIGKSDKEQTFPTDVKLMIENSNAPKDFLGIQVQVSINRVGSTAYPYAYTVIIARHSLGLTMNKTKSSADHIVHEYKQQDEMDILVIRQFTTKTSGYHTKDAIIYSIVQDATATALQLLFKKDKNTETK